MKLIFSLILLFFFQVCYSQELEEKEESNTRLTKPKELNDVSLEKNNDKDTLTQEYIIKHTSKSNEIIEGELIEFKDDRIDLLIQNYSENKKTIGYRVQLFSGNSRSEADKIRLDFLKKYKNEKPPHLVYNPPNFKIRVGDYRDRLEAQKFLELYKIDFPSAFAVKDEIEFKTIEY